MRVYGVIMAGGQGTRFWPLSRQAKPKQLLNLSGNDLMINETVDRLAGIIAKENMFIVTNQVQADAMTAAVRGKLDEDHILVEPDTRNTAACIGYAACELLNKFGDGIMCVFPADHYIEDQQEFERILKVVIREASLGDKLLTIGITPVFPATGYGYMKYSGSQNEVLRKVEEFKEKPSSDLAKTYLENGTYAWNSGMFVWKVSVILENFKEYLPEIYKYLMQIYEGMGTLEEKLLIQEIYPQIPSISIDYGIMERAEKVYMVLGDFGWSDVGSWETLDTFYKPDRDGNIGRGECVRIDTKNCIQFSDKKLIATIGVENLIIVETEDALLVCSKDRAQDVKLVVDQLKNTGKNQYL